MRPTSDMDHNSKCFKCQINMNLDISCSICKASFHFRCTSISKNDPNIWSSWFCEVCSSMFPFNTVDDNQMLKFSKNNANYEIVCNDTMVFNPFDLNRYDHLEDVHNLEFDPDMNFFSDNDNPQHCKYYNEEQFNSLIDSQSKDCTLFSVFHLNIRSLPKNYDQLVNLLSTLNHTFSVIGLSESWLTENSKESGLYELPSYNSVHSIRQYRTGGGVSIFVQENIQFIHRDDLVLKCNDDVESIFIEIMTDKGKNIVIGNIYRPPDTDISTFNEGLNKALESISKEDKICHILGDFNINLFKTDTHSPTEQFINMLHANFFFSHNYQTHQSDR